MARKRRVIPFWVWILPPIPEEEALTLVLWDEYE